MNRRLSPALAVALLTGLAASAGRGGHGAEVELSRGCRKYGRAR